MRKIKLLVLLLTFVLSFCLISCGSPSEEPTFDDDIPTFEDDFDPNEGFNPDFETEENDEPTETVTDGNDEPTETVTEDIKIEGFMNYTNPDLYDEPFTQRMSNGGKTRIVNRRGNPQLILSALLRTDLLINADFLDESEIEDYFAICKETGFNTIELSIMWSQVEPTKDNYDFSGVKYYLDFAKKYDLKINIEWYGSLVDGASLGANVPKYITSNPKTYPVIADLFDYANFGRCRIMKWDDSKLLERERLALFHLMNYIYDWNHENDLYDPVITVQLGQGADRFQRWRIESYGIKGADGNPYDPKDAWAMVNTYINEMGRAVKYSKYKALTRSEFCEQNAVVAYVDNIAKLEFVDIVSPTYLHELSATKGGIQAFANRYKLMTVMNVENWANDINHKQMLATMAMGGSGYVSYQLSCPNYFPESPEGALYGRYNPNGATLAEKFTERNTRATDTKQINSALSRAFIAVANAKASNFAALGMNALLNNKSGDARIQKIYMDNGLLLTFSNPNDCLGYAIFDSNCLYVYCNKDATLEINNCFVPVAQKGYFDADGNWVGGVEDMFALTNGKVINMKADIVYRIRITKIGELPSKDELRNGGYKTVTESLRG